LLDTAALLRNDAGVVRVSAANRRDAAKLLGFAHAQDRFFEMDLLRRTAAGELAELLGPRRSRSTALTAACACAKSPRRP
jgi:penicillin amidase